MPLLSTALLAALIGSLAPSVEAAPDPLFATDTLLEITLNAPLRAIIRDRANAPEDRPGTLGYTGQDGNEIWIDVGVRARGKSRREKDTCRFPPIRINVQKKEVAHSLFAHQDKLKLVTHCNSSARYEQYLLKEYLVYNTLNVLTDNSFKVRLLKVHYLDGDKDLGTFSGFFIEHKDRLAKRIDRKLTEPVSVVRGQLESAYTGLIELFQLMIGNTDFSFLRGPGGDVCCHNVVLFANDGQFQPIPYDFDATGIVNPPYAVPNDSLRLKSVTQRMFRGFCRSEESIATTSSLFQTAKTAIYELFSDRPILEGTGLTKRTSEKATKYLDSFYAIIDDPKQIDRRINQKCR
ncbi:MAG: hypothetical protein O7G86_11850 [Gammaproteobacteria bacterium]|nr:hypothetical protein [Gammaproteobacteria bacterium]